MGSVRITSSPASVKGPNHTWLHLDKEANPQRQTNASLSSSESTPGNVTSYTSKSSDHCRQALLMTCQVRLTASDGSTTIARALLDSASSTSFVTERLAQHLHLPRQYCYTQISGIGSITTHIGSRGVVNFKVSPATRCGKVMAVEAVVLLKVTTNVPSTSVPFDNNWKHLSNLHSLADPDFGTTGTLI